MDGETYETTVEVNVLKENNPVYEGGKDDEEGEWKKTKQNKSKPGMGVH